MADQPGQPAAAGPPAHGGLDGSTAAGGDALLPTSSGAAAPVVGSLDDLGGPASLGTQVEMLAAQLRADAADVATFFTVLVDTLGSALGDRVRVERRGGGWRRRPAEVTAVEVDLTEAGDGLVLRAERHGGDVQCTVARPVRGIVLSNRPVAVIEWVDQLVRVLAERADRSAQGRDALGGLVT